MKKVLSIGLTLVMCCAFAGMAAAQEVQLPDPTVITINPEDVTKTIAVTEDLTDRASTEMLGYFDKQKFITIDTYKHINVFFNTEIEVNADGEAETWGQQGNFENLYEDKGDSRTITTTTEETGQPKVVIVDGERVTVTPVTRTETVEEVWEYNERVADMGDSINGNNGVVGVNQSPGNMNNQANLSAMAVIAGDKQLVEANGFGVQASMFNIIYGQRSVNTNTISGSISDNNGIVGVNQSSGNVNNQFNSAALAAGLDPVTNGALGECTLKQVNADSYLVHVAVLRTDTIAGSINGNAGIVSVNQASGDLVNQANIHAIAADLN
jgi:hypothetical protein